MNRFLFFLATSLLIPNVLQAEPQPSQAKKLPRVLIIGDSISIGYTPFVIKHLEGVAVVKHNPGNGQHTHTGKQKLDNWLGETEWDVIHFNWGLWDLSHRLPSDPSVRDKVNGQPMVDLAQYEKNLDELVTRLKKTGAVLIWASTTVVPENEPGRKVEDALAYNKVAERVMKKHGVIVNDLYSLSAEFPAELFVKPGDVHYTPEGSQKLAAQVTTAIQQALEKPNPQPE